jgi:hypothetical protein
MAGQSGATGGIVYPTSYGQSSKSDETVFDNIITDRSVGGVIRRRSTVPRANIKKVFTVVHEVVSLTEKTAIQTFYETNRDSNIDLLWKPDALHYAVIFIDVPKYTMIGGLFWKAEVKFAEI